MLLLCQELWLNNTQHILKHMEKYWSSFLWRFDPMISLYGVLRSLLLDTLHSVRLLRTSDQPDTDKTQHSLQTNNHAPAGFETTIPAIERPQTNALYRTATGIGWTAK